MNQEHEPRGPNKRSNTYVDPYFQLVNPITKGSHCQEGENNETEPNDQLVSVDRKKGHKKRTFNFRESLESYGGLVINAVLAILTYLLFAETVSANKTAAEALKQAQKGVDEAHDANELTNYLYACFVLSIR